MDGWMSGVLSPCSLGSRTTDLPHISNVTYVCVCMWCMVCVVRLFVLVSSFRVHLPLGRVGFNKVCV